MDIKARLKSRKYGPVYYDRRWRKLRDKHLSQHPLCEFCLRDGKYFPADVVDHIIPHRGNRELMYDASNLQSLCKHHHDSDKQRMEKGGALRSIGEDGLPIDPEHHWNQ